MSNQMTCGELIKKLSKFPKDKPVKILAMGSKYEEDFPDAENIDEVDYSYTFEDEYDEKGEPILEENKEWVGIFTKEYCDDLLMKELPAPVDMDCLELEGTPHIFENLALKINEKQEMIKQLQDAKDHELACKIDYTHKCNKIKLQPDMVKESLGLSKAPTEKQINAYCEEKYSREFDMLTVAKANTSLLNTKLDLINDYISLEKYIIRMALK